VAREHGQHCAVEQADQQRTGRMDDGSRDECAQAEVQDLRKRGIGPAGDASSSLKIYCVPDAVIPNETIQQCRHNHGSATGDAAFDPGRD
jgi:hypothetical protein